MFQLNIPSIQCFSIHYMLSIIKRIIQSIRCKCHPECECRFQYKIQQILWMTSKPENWKWCIQLTTVILVCKSVAQKKPNGEVKFSERIISFFICLFKINENLWPNEVMHQNTLIVLSHLQHHSYRYHRHYLLVFPIPYSFHRSAWQYMDTLLWLPQMKWLSVHLDHRIWK